MRSVLLKPASSGADEVINILEVFGRPCGTFRLLFHFWLGFGLIFGRRLVPGIVLLAPLVSRAVAPAAVGAGNRVTRRTAPTRAGLSTHEVGHALNVRSVVSPPRLFDVAFRIVERAAASSGRGFNAAPRQFVPWSSPRRR